MSQSIDKFRQMRDEKRKQLAAIMAQEEQQAGSFHQLRESYAKMLASRFSFSTEAAQWGKSKSARETRLHCAR